MAGSTRVFKPPFLTLFQPMNIFSRLCFAVGVLFSGLTAQAQAPVLQLIPLPARTARLAGEFHLTKRLTASCADYPGDSVRLVFDRFAEKLDRTAGIKIKKGKLGRSSFNLLLNPMLPAEGYTLHVDKNGVRIEAARPAGFFYALQTLQQLLPTREVLADTHISDGAIALSIPAVSITDSPRFCWRGFMLDEGRHFYGKQAVKRIIDVMATYKMNRFHWHLTEDQGWRIEMERYPKLTTVGAWRDSRVLGWGDTKPDGIRYGGYYTKDDIREIVAYARDRFVEIVPEVDIPGHSQAAVASYPELLACDPEKAHEVWLWQGVSNDVINVAKPEAVKFARDVIDELTELFPFEYIHLGGDECPTTKWEANELCRERLARLGSTNYRDLQTDFYAQLKKYIDEKPIAQQRKLIFWNEVLHGNTASMGKDITIMAWVGADGAAKEAAERGLQTILTPQIPYYINRRQSKLPTEPVSQGYGDETVEAVYAYRPMKNIADRPDLQSRYLGVQANFWTEWVEDASTVEYLTFPRLAAVAEAGWTPEAARDYNDFIRRLQPEANFYRLKGMNYGKHVFE